MTIRAGARNREMARHWRLIMKGHFPIFQFWVANNLKYDYFVVALKLFIELKRKDMEKSKLFKSFVTVKWGDCDPAGIIYTPKILEYAMVAMENWFKEVPGVSWYELNMHLGMGSPIVRTEIDFLLILKVDQEISMNVEVQKLGNSSLTMLVTGNNAEEDACFRVMLVFCFIKQPDYKPIPIPDNYREKIEAYMEIWNSQPKGVI